MRDKCTHNTIEVRRSQLHFLRQIYSQIYPAERMVLIIHFT
jgi:hypothetical protein